MYCGATGLSQKGETGGAAAGNTVLITGGSGFRAAGAEGFGWSRVGPPWD